MSTLLTAIGSFYTEQMPMLVIGFPILLLPYVLLERLYPLQNPPQWREYVRNFAINLSSAVITAPLGIAAAHGAAAIREIAPWPTLAFTFSDIGVGSAIADPPLRVLAMIVVPLFMHDFWFYWSHRLEHRFSLLWRFHRLHHSDRNMNASTYARDHFLQNAWRAFFSLFTLGLAFDLDMKDAEQAALLSNVFLVLLSQLYHSATRIRLPWLDRILVTPQVHRIHHSLEAQHRDKNFADALPIFDILFGTYWRPAKNEFPQTGLDDYAPPSSWWLAQWQPLADLLRGKS